MIPETTNIAIELTKKFALRGADAVHLASALLLQKRLLENDQIIFVTSDIELKTSALSSGLSIIDPNEQEAQP
jgi:hypothetical protein